MRTEVHVHGSVFLCKGVRPSQIDQAFRTWLDYLDVDTIADAHSLEREEPGISFDPKERVVNICWTGEVGRSFQSRLTEAFHNIGPLAEYASEVEITYYPEGGDEEFYQMFVGPSPQAIHEFRRQCVVEDVSSMLLRHLGKAETEQVAALINKLFDASTGNKPQMSEEPMGSSTVIPLHPRNKHLH
ncbi:MAG: DUF6806 family protein [Pseudomonadota bacterium]